MENFVVSARKYRPATFDSVVGQSHITTTLKNAIKNNHLAQAFLFCGPRGVGKTTNARILAKTINCENITADIEACNECVSCKSYNNNASFNVHELDAASNNSVDDIRNLVDQVRYPPQQGKYKIYIIDEVHMLSTAAFNAFLKTLEEPPAYAIFILATTEKHKIIPTILSRCQIFDFKRIQVKDIATHLADIAKKENIQAEPQALHLIAQKADGALRDALSIFDLIVTFSAGNSVTYKTTIENLHILDYDYYFKITDALYSQDMPASLLIFDEIIREGFDGHNFIVGLSEHFRNLMVCKDASTVKLLEVSEDVQKKYAGQAAAVSLSFLMSALNIANTCDLQYKASKNSRLLIELGLMKMAYLNSVINLASSSPAPGEIKKKSEPVASEFVSEKKVMESKPLPPSETSAPSSSGPKPGLKTPNLKDLKNEVAAASKPEEKKNLNNNQENTIQISNEPVDPIQLRDLWQEYAMILRNEGKKNEYIIMDRHFDLKGDTIHLMLENSVQQDQLNKFRSHLLDFLRSRLSNAALSVETDIKADDGKKVIFTSQEKFTHLAEKFPIAEELKKKLGLETDF